MLLVLFYRYLNFQLIMRKIWGFEVGKYMVTLGVFLQVILFFETRKTG